MRLIKIILFTLLAYNGYSQNIGVRQVRGLQGSLNAKYSSVTTLSDSTGFTLNRPNGTKDTIQINIPAATDTSSLSKRINTKVDTIYRTAGKDSIQFLINGRYYSVKDSTGAGSGGSGTDPNAIHTSGNETIFSGTKTITSSVTNPNGTGALYNVSPFKVTPTLQSFAVNDTLAAIYINPTYSSANGTTSSHQWGLLSMSDISVRDVRIGIGKSTDQTNVVFGQNALNTVTTGTSNGFVAIGAGALQSTTNASFENVGVGHSAGKSITSGTQNTAVGGGALSITTSGTIGSNTAIGYSALNTISGSSNVGIGINAGKNSASGGVYIGAGAGQSETGSNKLYIHNSSSGGLIIGDFSTGQVQINAETKSATPTSLLTSAAAFEVNNTSVSNRGSIPAPVMVQATRDLIATQSGKVTRIVFSANGTGYSSAPTVTISGGGGTGATATATFNAGGFYFTVTNGGSGYTSSPTVTLSGGGGTGATAYAIVGTAGLSVYCLDCTATDASTGVLQYWNGNAWKNAW